MSKEFGVKINEVSEYRRSKICSNCGNVINDLGTSKVYNCSKFDLCLDILHRKKLKIQMFATSRYRYMLFVLFPFYSFKDDISYFSTIARKYSYPRTSFLFQTHPSIEPSTLRRVIPNGMPYLLDRFFQILL